jgi:hypothetical protein
MASAKLQNRVQYAHEPQEIRIKNDDIYSRIS